MSNSTTKRYNGKTIPEWSKETGIKECTIRYRLNAGKTIDEVLDPHIKTPSESPMKYDVVGKTFEDRFGNKFIVKEVAYRDKYKVSHYRCVFTESGYETIAVSSQIIGKSSHVFDRYSPSVHGVGILGDAYIKDNPKLFDVWRAMIARCYNSKNPNYKTYGARGVTVCERWKRFDYFLEDVQSIQGYDQEKIDAGIIVLDKDIIDCTTKIYSLDKCCFVTKAENTRESANRRWKERKV